jgi:hypothetical protein
MARRSPGWTMFRSAPDETRPDIVARTTGGTVPERDASDSFEWPPPVQHLTPYVLEAADEPFEGILKPAGEDAPVVEHAKEQSPAAHPRADPIHNVPLERALRDTIERKEAAQCEAALRRTPSTGSRMPFSRVAALRSYGLPGALTALALLAIVEGAYILYLQSRGPEPASVDARLTDRTSAREQRLPLPVANRGTALPRAAGDVAPPSPSPAPKETPQTNGRLLIRSEPSGAKVLINGRSYGVTPLALGNVTPGEHQIVLQRGETEVRQKVRVEPGGTASLVVPLAQSGVESGWIAIEAPIELDLIEDGVLLGTSRSRQLMIPAGTHTLQLVNEQAAFLRSEKFRVEPGKVHTIGVELPQSLIHLNATPWAEVWIDGKSIGETPIGNFSLPIGTHEVIFRHPELGERIVSTVIKAGVPTRLTADLRKDSSARR